MVIEDENDTDNVEQDHEDCEEEVLFVVDYDSDDDHESEEDANSDEIIDLMKLTKYMHKFNKSFVSIPLKYYSILLMH